MQPATATSIWHDDSVDPSTVPAIVRWRLMSDDSLRDIAERLTDHEHPMTISRDYGIHSSVIVAFSKWLLPRKSSEEQVTDDDDDDTWAADALRARRSFLRSQMVGIDVAAAAVARLRTAIEVERDRLEQSPTVSQAIAIRAKLHTLGQALLDAEDAYEARERARDELLATAPERLRRRYARLSNKFGVACTAAIDAESLASGAQTRLELYNRRLRISRKRSWKKQNTQRLMAKRMEDLASVRAKIEGLTASLVESPSRAVAREIAELKIEAKQLTIAINKWKRTIESIADKTAPAGETLSRGNELRRELARRQEIHQQAEAERLRLAQLYHTAFNDLITSDGDEPQSAVERLLNGNS